jgi:DNA-binding response OmpR family regulator
MGMTVLLVEDDLAFAQMLSVVIRQVGFEVILAASVHEATEQIDSRPFDALVLDFGLPDGDACDVMAHVGTPPPAPVYIVSAEPNVAKRLHNAPVTRIFSKPLDTSAFRSELRAIAQKG